MKQKFKWLLFTFMLETYTQVSSMFLAKVLFSLSLSWSFTVVYFSIFLFLLLFAYYRFSDRDFLQKVSFATFQKWIQQNLFKFEPLSLSLSLSLFLWNF